MVDDLIVTAGIAALDGEVQNLGEHPGEVGVEEDVAAANSRASSIGCNASLTSIKPI